MVRVAAQEEAAGEAAVGAAEAAPVVADAAEAVAPVAAESAAAAEVPESAAVRGAVKRVLQAPLALVECPVLVESYYPQKVYILDGKFATCL